MSEPINWSWFDNVQLPNVTSDVLNSIFNISNIVSSLVFTAEDKAQTVKDIDNLIYTITGVSVTPPNNLISQEEWYNIWLTQNNVNTFSFSVNFIIQKVKTNQTSDTNAVLSDLDNVCQFILYRHFSTPIPEGYPNAGNKPRLVDNKSEYYTDMTLMIYNFFINGGEGINGIGNNTITEMCSNFTRTTISNYIPIKNWCGCFAPESKLTKEAKAIYPDSATYTAACDPLCIFPGAIKIVDSDGSNSICRSTLCIMSNFDLANADINGVINLEQNCPCSDSSQPCFCVIDSTIESLLNKTRSPNGGSMADPITFKQYCPGAQCYVEQPNGDLKQVQCQNDNPGQTGNIDKRTSGSTSNISNSIWFLFFCIIVVFIMFIQCARYIGFEPKYKVKGLLKPKVKLSKNIRSSDIGFLKKI
jgi:hypothetical protein